jgi:hypothetical protein
MNLAEESLVAEVTAQIVMELTHGASSSLHSFGFQALWDLYQLPYGQQYLHRLGRDARLSQEGIQTVISISLERTYIY